MMCKQFNKYVYDRIWGYKQKIILIIYVIKIKWMFKQSCLSNTFDKISAAASNFFSQRLAQHVHKSDRITEQKRCCPRSIQVAPRWQLFKRILEQPARPKPDFGIDRNANNQRRGVKNGRIMVFQAEVSQPKHQTKTCSLQQTVALQNHLPANLLRKCRYALHFSTASQGTNSARSSEFQHHAISRGMCWLFK